MESPPVFKRVLYYARTRALSADFFAALGEAAHCRPFEGSDDVVITSANTSFRFVVRHDVAASLDTLHRDFFNLVLLDLREPVHGLRSPGDFELGLELLDVMDQEPDVERRYGFHRIVALVSGADALEVDARIASLGARGVVHVMRDLAACPFHEHCEYLPAPSEFARRVLGEIVALTLHRDVGKLALCASGGGITGMYFEMGSIKCLEDCCRPGATNDFDMYFGISGGSVICGMLANGYTVSEFMAAIAGVDGGRVEPLDLNLLGVAHLDYHGLVAPFLQMLSIVWNGAAELLHGRLPFSLESLVFEYGDLVHAPFNTEGFGALLERGFSSGNRTNDFRKLRHPLYIGATDQDLKRHVLFGEPPNDHVPISLAIQASMSLNPVFAPKEIGGRFYEDGAVTRTSNFVDAMRKGADLVFVIDPLVPYVSKEPGFARARGVVYNTDQDIRTVLYTRYETTKNWVLRRHPEISLYTFLPGNRLRRLMSVNPMDHRPYLEIWRGAYLSTLRRIHTLSYRMRGDLGYHGIPFDTSRADAVAERLRACEQITFADFFPDGRIDLSVTAPPRTPSRDASPVASHVPASVE